MDYTKLIEAYVGRTVTFGYDNNMNELECELIDHSDGNGVQIEFWNITDKPQPTIAELEALQPQLDIIQNNEIIKAQIAELDTKRLRAICEPSIKDATTGQTWLEYYNAEIAKLREQIR